MSRLRRVLLFMPGDDLRKIEKGAASGVDSVIMDLEDGVAYSRKDAARQTIVKALGTLGFSRSEKLIRINPVSDPQFQTDLTTTAGARPDGYVIPKVETADQVRHVSQWLDSVEHSHNWPPGAIRLLALIESAAGIVAIREIASADRRLDALIFGAEDYAGSVGATRTADGLEVLWARSTVVAHAAAVGLQAIDTPFVNFQDTNGLARDAAFAAQLGYTGKLAIHPRQIELLNRAFNPSKDAIAYAQQVLTAFDEQQRNGAGVFALDGKMIDEPMAKAARTVIERAGAAGLLTKLE
ncbi:MAG: HpcH/HpaI aldolase/citrate lyase family protein [Aggregatilineales bacterium]